MFFVSSMLWGACKMGWNHGKGKKAFARFSVIVLIPIISYLCAHSFFFWGHWLSVIKKKISTCKGQLTASKEEMYVSFHGITQAVW